MLTAAHEELRRMDPAGLSRDELETSFRALAKLESRLVERRLAFTAAIDRLADGGVDGEGMHRSAGKRSTRTARKAAKTASKLEQMPRTRRALAEGRINEEHAAAAADAAERTSPEVADEELVGNAEAQPADLFAAGARKWASAKERDDARETRHARQRANRELRTWTDVDGMHCLFARFDAIDGELLKGRLAEQTDRLWRSDGGRDGSPDDIRTRDQRAADALIELIAEGPRTGRRPHPKFQVVAVVDVERLRADDPHGVARLADGTALPQSVLERISCDAAFVGAIYGADGAVLWQGRSTRLATDDQWTQLIARDGGCVVCASSPDKCEAHHLVPFAPPSLGNTDIDDLALVCGRDHHLIHDHGYVLVRVDDGWELRPPDWQRRPLPEAEAA